MGTSQLTRGLLRNTMVRLMRGSVEATTTRSCSGSRPRKQRKQPLKGCCWSYERASQKYSREPQSRESLTDYFLRPPSLTFLLWQKCAFRLVVKVNVVVFPPCAPLDWKSQVAFWLFEISRHLQCRGKEAWLLEYIKRNCLLSLKRMSLRQNEIFIFTTSSLALNKSNLFHKDSRVFVTTQWVFSSKYWCNQDVYSPYNQYV